MTIRAQVTAALLGMTAFSLALGLLFSERASERALRGTEARWAALPAAFTGRPEFAKEALAELRRESRGAFVQIAALGLLAGGLIAWGLGAYLTQPVIELADAARRVGHGDFSARVEEPPANELGELARQFEAMTQTLRALETLRDDRISHVSHDVRSPLAAVEMLADYLLNQDPDRSRLTPDQKAKLATIQDSARRLRVFAANVLDAAKLRAGRMTYRREPVELAAAARRAVALFGLFAEQKGVRLSHTIAEGAAALADPERFDQALANLVSNALKYTPEGGSVSIAAERAGPRVKVSVADTGSGIGDEQKAKLFTAFGVAAAAPGALPSAGLGLFVVKETVAGMGGTVSVESAPGKGTTFLVELPAA
ncbi:MAG: HAMP domain-containing histidine kinase [Elusimicrobia bacterium]|nr:HAMP domain-containing histidine kinase [Elusimicrobiota bacterium]